MAKKIRHFLFLAFSMGLTLCLSGCKMALLDPKGMVATSEKHILIVSVLLMLIVVIPVIIMTLAFAWRYRETNTQAKYDPNWSHSTLLEVIWWSIPCLIVIALGFITWRSTFELDPYRPLDDKDNTTITIQAISLEWKWLFIYPEQNIATVNYIQIPVNRPVRFLISAEGPMNSFQIPQLGGQIYAMAGMQTKLHLIANEMGDYQGVSANFTGDGFSKMKFTVHASSAEQFDEWVKTVKQSSNQLTMANYHQLMRPSEDEAVKYYASANKNIFEMVVMRSMMPMPMKDEAEPSEQHLASLKNTD